MLIFFKSVSFLGGVVPLFLGLFIYLKNKKEILTKTYFGMSTCCAIWSVGFFMMLSSTNDEMAYFWRTFMDIGAIIIPAFWIHFVYSVLGLNTKKSGEIFFYYVIALSIITLNIADSFFPGIFVKAVTRNAVFNYYPVAGFGYYLFLLFYLVLVPRSLYFLIKHYYKNTGTKVEQIKYLIIAACLGFLGGGTAFLLTFGISIPPYGIVFFAFYPVAIAYTVTKHHLFNIKVVATQLLVSFLSIFVFVRAVIAENTQERIINGVLFVITTIVGMFLVRSVIKEVEQRERIEKLAKELEDANKRQEGLLHFISHEVKGFFTKSKWAFSGIIDGEYGPVPDDLKALAGQGLKDVDDGVNTVEGILHAGNLKTGTVKFEMKPFDLKTAVLEWVAKLKPEALKKNLAFETVIDESQTYNLNGDEGQISKHVIRNLIDNAIKYTPSGSIVVSLKKEGDRILFSVKDSGVGITEEDKKHLFTEGGRGKDAVKVNVHSTGFGLFIAKNIVDAHKGRIWAESEGSGKGSTFFVEI